MDDSSVSDPKKPVRKFLKYVEFDLKKENAFIYTNKQDVRIRASESFVIGQNNDYQFRLRILARAKSSSDNVCVAALRMEPVSALDNEYKNLSVKFSILDVINQKVREQPGYFAIDSWICPNLIEFLELHSRQEEFMNEGKLVIVVDIDLDTEKTNAHFLLPNVPKCQALDDFGRLFEEQILTDVTLNICGKEIHAHKAILAVRSSVFSAMFEHEMIEKKRSVVDVADMDFEVFMEMLRFIYTGKCPNIKTKTDQLLSAADMYDLKRLKIMCENELGKYINVENAAHTLILADLHGAAQLKIQAINFFTSHTNDVMDTEGYKEMKNSFPHLIDDILRASTSISNKNLQTKEAQKALLKEL